MKKFGKLAVLAALILALACFVSCKNDDDDDSGSGNAPTTTVELTGTTDPTFEDGSKTYTYMGLSGEKPHCEMTISGNKATLKWVKANSGGNNYVNIYENGEKVGEIDFDMDVKLEARWIPKGTYD